MKKWQLSIALALLILAVSGHAREYSWNLSRDMSNGITTNPTDVWTFMEDVSGTGLHTNFEKLPGYNFNDETAWQGRVNFWGDTSTNLPMVGIILETFTPAGANVWKKGMPLMAPGPARPAIIKWTSPIKGTVSVIGTTEGYLKSQVCSADGIKWSLRLANNVIQEGLISNSGSAGFAANNIPVVKGSPVHFIVSERANTFCDWTNVDLLITGRD